MDNRLRITHNISVLAGTIQWTPIPGFTAHFKVSANFRALMDIPSDLGCNHLFATLFDQVEPKFDQVEANTKSNNVSKLEGTIEWIPSSELFAQKISNLVSTIEWTISSNFAAHFGVYAGIRTLIEDSNDITYQTKHKPSNSNHETAVCQADIPLCV